MPRQAAAMTLRNTVIVRAESVDDGQLIAHELVHVGQFRDLGSVVFAARYVGSYLRLRFGGHRHMAAYRRIPLEVEASWLSRLHDVKSLEPGFDPAIEPRDYGRKPVRAAQQPHRGPDRMWRRRQMATARAQVGAE